MGSIRDLWDPYVFPIDGTLVTPITVLRDSSWESVEAESLELSLNSVIGLTGVTSIGSTYTEPGGDLGQVKRNNVFKLDAAIRAM